MQVKSPESKQKERWEMVSRKRRYDLREFWPWYERSVNLPPGAGNATPPPFTLADIGKLPDTRSSTPNPFLWLAIGLALLAFVLWALLH